MRKFSLFLSITVALIAVLAVWGQFNPVQADCPGGANGDDAITCDTDLPNPDGPVEGGSGDDVIIVLPGATVNPFGIDGDSTPGVNGGDDYILNNGWVLGGIWGDYVPGANGGDDTLINNGIVNWDMIGDGEAVFGGDDTITNNGTVGGGLVGDQAQFGGDDTLINNGIIAGSIDGDQAEFGGDDYIENNGFVFGICGDAATNGGDDVIINNGDVNHWINGDCSVLTTGEDEIINNGFASGINGDGGDLADGNDDYIENNGVVAEVICGDGLTWGGGGAGGDDVIVNNGYAGNLVGDCADASGDDVILNYGYAGSINGDGSPFAEEGDDYILSAGIVGPGGIWTAGGDDVVAVGTKSVVDGWIDGGWENTGDTLMGLTPKAIENGGSHLVFSATCATLPALCSGPISVNYKGNDFTFVNFELIEIWR